MAIRYYTTTYIELTSADALPVPSMYGLRAHITDLPEDNKFTFIDGQWVPGWFGDAFSDVSQTAVPMDPIDITLLNLKIKHAANQVHIGEYYDILDEPNWSVIFIKSITPAGDAIFEMSESNGTVTLQIL